MKSGRVSLAAAFVVACLAVVPRTAAAFDGDRQGFILGLGAGVGNLTTNSSFFRSMPAIGAQTDFKLGYGVSDRLSVYYTGKQFWYSADHLFLTNLFPMLGATYRLQPSERALSVSFGGGASLLAAASHGEGGAGAGGAAFVGLGYQVAPHWEVELHVLGSGLVGASGLIYNVGLTLNALAY